MALVINIADHFIEPGLESIVVWAGPTGRPKYGSCDGYRIAPKTLTAPGMDGDWMDAVEAAQALADRHAISTVYVVKR